MDDETPDEDAGQVGESGVKKDVYFIRAGDTNRYKIGFAADAKKRLKSLQTGSRDPLSLEAVISTVLYSELEKYLHAALAEQRSVSGEWFKLDEPLLKRTVKQGRVWARQREEVLAKVAELATLVPQVRTIPSSKQASQLHQRHVSLRSRIEALEVERRDVEDAMRLLIGAVEGIDGVATWKMQRRVSLDVKRLKEEAPDVFAKYSQESSSRVLRVSRNLPDEK